MLQYPHAQQARQCETTVPAVAVQPANVSDRLRLCVRPSGYFWAASRHIRQEVAKATAVDSSSNSCWNAGYRQAGPVGESTRARRWLPSLMAVSGVQTFKRPNGCVKAKCGIV